MNFFIECRKCGFTTTTNELAHAETIIYLHERNDGHECVLEMKAANDNGEET